MHSRWLPIVVTIISLSLFDSHCTEWLRVFSQFRSRTEKSDHQTAAGGETSLSSARIPVSAHECAKYPVQHSSTEGSPFHVRRLLRSRQNRWHDHDHGSLPQGRRSVLLRSCVSRVISRLRQHERERICGPFFPSHWWMQRYGMGLNRTHMPRQVSCSHPIMSSFWHPVCFFSSFSVFLF